jgi:general secretion pathway protein D
LKTTAHALVGWIALTLVLAARTASAGVSGCEGATGVWLASVVLGQSAPDAAAATADPRQQAADLLNRARQAMDENDLVTADALISRAEALGVKYSIFHRGDTPHKARRDLEQKRNGGSAAKSAGGFLPLKSNRDKQIPTNDPFAGHVPDPSAAASVTPLPHADAAPMPMQPGGGAAASDRTAGGNAHPLRKARIALAVGDVRSAAEFVRQARALQANYQPSDDNPDKVEAAIRNHQAMAGVDRNTEAYARLYARDLTDQADALTRWGEYDGAEQLARRAAGVRIAYGPTEQNPRELLDRISTLRRSGGTAAAPDVAARQRAALLVRQARDAMANGNTDRAEALARQAEQMRLPPAAFSPTDDRPELVLLDIQQMRERAASSGVRPTAGSYVVQAGGNGEPDRTATRAYYNPAADTTRNVQAAATEPTFGGYTPSATRYSVAANANQPAPVPAPMPAGGTPQSPGMALFLQGEAALRAHDATRAYEFYRQAANYPNDLDAATAQRLQERLQLLANPSRHGPTTPAGTTPSMVDQAAGQRNAAFRQLATELANRKSGARAMLATNPRGALTVLEEGRRKIETSDLDAATRDRFLRDMDRSIAEARAAINENRPQLDQIDKNDHIRQEVARSQRLKIEVQEKVALLVDQYKRLTDEQRYPEALVVAKQADALAPDDPVVRQVLWNAKFVQRYREGKAIEAEKEEKVVQTLVGVDKAGIPFGDETNPMQFPDKTKWASYVARSKKYGGPRAHPRTEQELDIEKRLRTPVSMQFTNVPLSQVIEYLAKSAGINQVLDPAGLSEEGQTSDVPVTINLTKPIMVKSALSLILGPLHLSYVIKDEVLKITSEQMRDTQTYPVVYNVADLVIPIPNFTPNSSMGLRGAYMEAMREVGFGGGMPYATGTSTPMTVAANYKAGDATSNASVLAQQMGGSSRSQSPGQWSPGPLGPGPGGLGGGAAADFEPLIEQILGIRPQGSWEDFGGQGTIHENPMNLTLTIDQTQEMHEKIRDLLDQMRRLQDLQVTIEVRFITLSDNFFERIGVDFDFDVNDNSWNINGSLAGKTVNSVLTDRDTSRTTVVGLSTPGFYSSDLDIQATQDSYTLAVPKFGGFTPSAGLSLGFAILSDVEAYFFINAAQGDQRTNVLQAPKVTLFNGQMATVSDYTASPFVISVIPVVGDFAAAQQPVIVVLNEGTMMTVQAVVSDNKRFVRLTVIPLFTKITEVNTFTFTGTTTTTTSSTREGLRPSATNNKKLWNNTGDTATSATSGVTVQLPSISQVSVATTVSVPDGGTILLGGIKRLAEGRNEFGTPLLNKIPYINRLFKNVSIGRQSESLMMMVTPRIIIQEEEEENLVGPKSE